MSETKKLSFLTRAAMNVDAKMNRTPADGEVATTESKSTVRQALVGAAIVAVGTSAAIYAFCKVTAKAVIEEETNSEETTED
jgi:hypothetical protein